MKLTTRAGGHLAPAATFSDAAALSLIATGLVALVFPVGVQVLWLALLILAGAALGRRSGTPSPSP
ncbi:MAG: hypothetical protein DLM61_05615 [Pseudonocardiales bacterium]|nr:MAG: hypothetical protein DLM61_05615 [Pseudonocardiales bacterium]